MNNFTATFAQLAHRVGIMSAPQNKLFFAPEIRGARIIALVSAAYLVLSLVLGALSGVMQYIIWATCLVAAYMVYKNVSQKQWLSYFLPIVAAAVILPVVLNLLGAVFGFASVFLIPLALLGLYGFVYKGGQLLDEPMRELGQQLGAEWEAYAPVAPLAATDSRVIKGPGKRLFYVSVVPGRLENQYGDEFLRWGNMALGSFDQALATETREREQFKPVMWVVQPPQSQHSYDIQLSRGVTTYIGDVRNGARELAEHFKNWETMMTNLQATQNDSSALGQEVERQAIAALSAILPSDWQIRTNLILTQGGDADIELISPLGRKYVVDIKARNDTPDINENDPYRPKHWRDIHEQLMLASRQLLAEPIIWQPRVRGPQGVMGEVRFVQGSAGDLLRFLASVHGETVLGARIERGKQHVVEDEAPLGELDYGGAGTAAPRGVQGTGSLIIEDMPQGNYDQANLN